LKGDFEKAHLWRAREVARFEDLTQNVRSGAMSLNEAHAIAKQRKRAAENKDETLEELRAEAPDLAELVEEGRQPLNEAFGALQERRKNERVNRNSFARVLSDFISKGDTLLAQSELTLLSAKYRIASEPTLGKQFHKSEPPLGIPPGRPGGLCSLAVSFSIPSSQIPSKRLLGALSGHG
jgi:hypothetical protein